MSKASVNSGYRPLATGPASTPASAPSFVAAELESPIDAGFETHVEFPRGVVETRLGNPNLDLSSLQEPLSIGQRLCDTVGAVVIGGTGVGIFYLLAKLTLIRRGEIGITEWLNGRCRVLGPGWHLNEVLNTRVTKASLTKDLITHGALKIIRILPGNLGLSLSNGNPVVLTTGCHLVNDPLFSFVRQEPLTNPHIQLETVNIITVQMGRVGLCTVDATAHFLEPGTHRINHPRFVFSGFKSTTDECISIGSKHRIRVPAGRIGLAWDSGEPLFIEPGQVVNVDSPTFSFAGSKPVTDPVIFHGRLRIITVKQGSWAISYDDGRLVILEPGRHILDKATHYLAGFLTGGLQVLPIPEVTSMTSDNVGISFDAAISVKVADPGKAVTMLGSMEANFDAKAIWSTIVLKSKMAMAIIIGNNHLNNSFKSTTRPNLRASSSASGAAGGAGASGEDLEDPTAAPSGSDTSFKQVIHDVFMHDFSQTMLTEFGIRVQDMSIEDVRITNPDLARAMAQGAVARTALIKAQIEQEVTRTEALGLQSAELIKAEGQAKGVAMTAAAEAQRINIIAAAEAARIRMIDDALASASAITHQRELIRASGEIVREAKSSVILAHSTADVANLLGGGRSGGGAAASLL